MINKVMLISIILTMGASSQDKSNNRIPIETVIIKTTKKMDSRDMLMSHITDGYDTIKVEDNIGKSILARGCDPEMGRRAVNALPPFLGNPKMVGVSSDTDFIEQLKSKKWSVIFFAPGACRYNAAKMPIPGSSDLTKGWNLNQYHELVKKYQGEHVQIVESIDEKLIIPLLRKALSESQQ